MSDKTLIRALLAFNLLLMALVALLLLKPAQQQPSAPLPAPDLARALDALEPAADAPPFQPESDFLLVVFFHGEGQCGCLDDWPNWNLLADKHAERLQVIGVFNGADEQAYRDFAAGVGLTFPLYHDPAGRLRERLGIRQRDVVKTLLYQGRDVLIQDVQQTQSRDQARFVRRVERHLDRIAPAPPSTP